MVNGVPRNGRRSSAERAIAGQAHARAVRARLPAGGGCDDPALDIRYMVAHGDQAPMIPEGDGGGVEFPGHVGGAAEILVTGFYGCASRPVSNNETLSGFPEGS